MKIKLYRSATIGVIFSNFKILQDPWLTDGEYYGSWFQYPTFDLKKNLHEINSYDAIYISHIHPDHCSEETLKKINKNIPIYIHKFHHKFLDFKLKKLGFNVIGLENGKRVQLKNNVHIAIFAADNCDPNLCYKFFSCANLNINDGSQQIDTLCVLDDNKNVLVNINDCPIELAESVFPTIFKNYSKIDVLLTAYGYAGAYPQCYDNYNYEQKKKISLDLQNKYLNSSLNYIEKLKPKFYMPFAGTYELGGKLTNLQDLIATPKIDIAHKFFEQYLPVNSKYKNTSLIKINPENTFCLEEKNTLNLYSSINQREYKVYKKNYLEKKKFIYEQNDDESLDSIFDLSKLAFENFLRKKKELNSKIPLDIYIKAKHKYIKISQDIKKDRIDFIESALINKNNKHIILDLDIRLLKLILKGPKYAHWNNAEIGSHISYFRSPDIHLRNVHQSICYFHC